MMCIIFSVETLSLTQIYTDSMKETHNVRKEMISGYIDLLQELLTCFPQQFCCCKNHFSSGYHAINPYLIDMPGEFREYFIKTFLLYGAPPPTK